MITVQEAERQIMASTPGAAMVEVPLADAAGEVLRETIVADRPFPPFHRVAMDGVALAGAAWQAGARRFPVEAVRKAGDPAYRLKDAAACVEVMTGAVLPDGCDCVVPVEQLDYRDGAACLPDDLKIQRMQNVHVMGSDRARGATLLAEGTVMLGPQCAVAATVGKAYIKVARRPRVALVSTGDELVDIEREPEPHQIRRSNDSAMRAALALAGFRDVDVRHLRDDEPEIEAALREMLDVSDMIILSGGVSVGRFDYVPDVLGKLGVKQVFHKVSQRPGKPMWFGVAAGGRLVFGLPGNPVSATVCLHRYVLPALWASLGPPRREQPVAVLGEPVKFKKALTLFQPVRIEYTRDGLMGCPAPMNGSGDLAGLAASDGFVELPAERETFEKGESFPLWLWGG